MAKQKDNYNHRIPEHEIESLARTFLPAIREFYDSEEGQREFEDWYRKYTNVNNKSE